MLDQHLSVRIEDSKSKSRRKHHGVKDSFVEGVSNLCGVRQERVDVTPVDVDLVAVNVEETDQERAKIIESLVDVGL